MQIDRFSSFIIDFHFYLLNCEYNWLLLFCTIMPALVQSNDDEDWELDLTTATKSDLLVSSRHTSPKSSVSRVSIPIDLPEVSLHNSPVPIVADLSVVPQSNLSSSLHTTSSDYIIDDLKKYV